MSFFGSGKSFPDQMPSILKVKVAGCKPEYGGVGLSLNLNNEILELVPGSAADTSKLIHVGDRVIGCDGVQMKGRQLSQMIVPGDVHEFEIERTTGWAGFSVEDTVVEEEEDQDGLKALDRTREVTVQKKDGQIGICPEVFFPDGEGSGVIKISKARPPQPRST
jgi:C-terminal processing protease CtpA/Prc